jgi:hypothetical protein
MRWVLVLVSLCVAQPAVAGQRAVYQDPDGKPLTIEVADNGDALVKPSDPDQYGVWQAGHFYLVSKEKGEWRVARIEDVAAALDRVMPPIFKTLFGAAAKGQPPSQLKIEPRGARRVAGYDGQVYAVTGMDDGSTSEKPGEFVMSRDPALQPTGKVMQEFLVSIIVPLAPLLGQGAAEMVTDMRTIFTYGAPLDLNGKFKLVSIEKTDMAASAVTLPAKPQTVEQIVASLKAAPAEPAAAP